MEAAELERYARQILLKEVGGVGQAALKKEKAEGSVWAMVGLEYDWVAMEEIYNKYENYNYDILNRYSYPTKLRQRHHVIM